MTSLKETLMTVLEDVGESWTPEERSLAEAVAQDYVTLLAKRVGGDDVEDALRDVRAQTASISAAGYASVSIALEEGIRGFLSDLMRDLIPGL